MLERVQGAENPKTLKTRRLQAQIRRGQSGDRDANDLEVEPYADESHFVPAGTGGGLGQARRRPLQVSRMRAGRVRRG